jgi:hypothetical protein
MGEVYLAQDKNSIEKLRLNSRRIVTVWSVSFGKQSQRRR